MKKSRRNGEITAVSSSESFLSAGFSGGIKTNIAISSTSYHRSFNHFNFPDTQPSYCSKAKNVGQFNQYNFQNFLKA